MAAQKGKDLLVKIEEDEAFVTIAGLRSRRLAFNAETVDVTHAESANRWRELLEGAGVKRASLAGRGLFKDASSDTHVRQTFFDGAVKNYQIVIPDFGVIQGAFQITSLEFAGEHNGEVTYELSLESAGELTFDRGRFDSVLDAVWRPYGWILGGRQVTGAIRYVRAGDHLVVFCCAALRKGSPAIQREQGIRLGARTSPRYTKRVCRGTDE